MRMIQSTTDDPSNGWTGGALISLEMVRFVSCLLRAIVLVVGVIVIPGSALFGEERSHPSLVDPAITKCRVCHTSLGAAHTGGASSEDCLTCHTLVKKSKKTFLVVEDSRPSGEIDDRQEPEKTGAGDITRRDNDTPVFPNTGAGRSEAPSVETIAVIAGEKADPSAAASATTGPSEKPNPVNEGGDQGPTLSLYAEGMDAFNSAQFDRAFETWWLMLSSRPDHWALQVELDTYLASAQSTLASYGEHSLYVVKKDDFHWVLSGLFATRAKAIEALKLLPEPLRQGGAFPITVGEIMSRP